MSNENSLNGSRASTTAAAGTTTRLLLLSSRARNKGPYFNNVYKIFGILDPSLFVCILARFVFG